MKKSGLFLAAIALGSACAAPMFYTFTGSVTSIDFDKGGKAAALNIKVGEGVSFVLEIDTARVGYSLQAGVKTEMLDSIDEGPGYHAIWFFDSLLTPSLFSPAVIDKSSACFCGYRPRFQPGQGISYEGAFETSQGEFFSPQTQLRIYLGNLGESMFLLPKVNDLVIASEQYSEGYFANSEVGMNLKCTAISATEPDAVRGRVKAQGPQSTARLVRGVLIDPGDRVFLASGRRARVLR